MLIVLQSFLADAVAVEVGSLPQSSLNLPTIQWPGAFDIYSGALLRFLDIYFNVVWSDKSKHLLHRFM